MSHKVTAGVSGLSPEQRLANDNAIRARAEQRALILDELSRSSELLDGEIATDNAQAQLGRSLDSSQVISKLQTANPGLIFEISLADPSKQGIYILRNNEKVFICGMENGLMPEFSIRHTRIKKIPDPDLPGQWISFKTFYKETRGWRTVLARLLREGYITEPQVYSLFNVHGGRSSENWKTLTT